MDLFLMEYIYPILKRILLHGKSKKNKFSKFLDNFCYPNQMLNIIGMFV